MPPRAVGGNYSLIGSPELPFSTRLSMTVAPYSLTSTYLLLVR